MRFRGLDLNLLVALQMLLETRSVSRAAEQLHVSQPAMSAALRRLREYFGDEILHVEGKRMYPTAFAETLVSHLRHSLGAIEALIATSNVFDPTTSEREFRLIASDYVTTAIVAPMLRKMVDSAPGVSLIILPPNEQSYQQIERGEADLVITPEDYIHPSLPAELLYEENHVVAGWKGNPLAQSVMTIEQFCKAGHVGVAVGNARAQTFGDRHLQALSYDRRLEVVASSFTMVPWLLRDTARLAIMHERLAQTVGKQFDLLFQPLPFPFPRMRQMVQFHRAREGDAGLQWFRQQLRVASHKSH